MSQGLILLKRPRDERMACFQVMGTWHAGACDRMASSMSPCIGASLSSSAIVSMWEVLLPATNNILKFRSQRTLAMMPRTHHLLPKDGQGSSSPYVVVDLDPWKLKIIDHLFFFFFFFFASKIIDHLIVNVCTHTWVIYWRKHCTFDRRRLVDRLSTETGSLCCRYCHRKKEDSGDHDYRWHWKLRGLCQLVGLWLSSYMLSIQSVIVPAILESRLVGSRGESLEREWERQRERLKNFHTDTWGWWGGGIFERKKALKGHMQCMWPTFRPNKRVTGRKVNFATRWQVREGHLTILVHWGVNRHPMDKTGR